MEEKQKEPVEPVPNEPTKNMGSKNNLILLGVGLLIIIALGGGYIFLKNSKNSSENMASTPPTQTNSTTSQVVSSSSPVPQVNTNTSNAQLDQDLQNIQGNLNQLGSDQTNASTSIQNQSQDIAPAQ